MPNYWFTSDTHFGHSKVIDYSSRPFRDADEMDEMMIRNWNTAVQPGDYVYHLGDFSFHKIDKTLQILRRLQGQKFLVFGNHDKRLRKEPVFLGHWAWTGDLKQIEIGGQKITLCHYAMLTWNRSHHGAWQLHGHSHGSLPVDPRFLRQDVGVDVWDYQPVSYDQLAKEMAKREYKPVDHHGQRDFEVKK